MDKRPPPPPTKNRIVVLTETIIPVVESIFPVDIHVAGVSMGDLYCKACNRLYPRGNNCCSICGNRLFSYRQYILERWSVSGNDIVDLVGEPGNSYDPFAVKVCIRFTDESPCVGYIPKKHEVFDSKVASAYITSGKPLFVSGKVVGGDRVETEDGKKGLFGLILIINDVPI